MEALGASVATHVTDACQVLVEQAAATGVEAALAKGRSADHKSALAKAEKAQGNTHGVSHSNGVHSKVSLCEPPLLWSTFCGRWCLTPCTPSIWV